MKKHLFVIAIALLSLSSCGDIENSQTINSYKGLVVAINQAEDGDTLLVGDIDFRGEEQLHKSIFRIDVSKDITIKGAYKNKKSIFTSGSFNLAGTKVMDDCLNVQFENICFDGDIDGASLSDASWGYEDIDDLEPRLRQYAMFYKGNVEASYSNCDFKNYMNENGGAFFALYGDYPGNEFILLNYGDNAQCKLSVSIDNCNFENNYSFYGGGAIYIEGCKENVDININNTKFLNNKTSCMDYAQGGGACFFSDLNSTIKNCEFSGNNGSYSYGLTRKDVADISDVPPEFVEDYLSSINDQTSGGAICTKQGNCSVINTKITGNNASLGGGIAAYNTKMLVDGCVFSNNTAMCDLLNNPNDSTGPWSMMGLGGAIYINSSDGTINEFWNSSFYENVARNGYGSIYSWYNGANDGGVLIYPDVKVNFCSFKDNKETISYKKVLTEWSARSGNGYEIPHIKYNACIVSDELSCNYFDKYEKPVLENNYCYFTDEAHLSSDKVQLTVDKESKHLKATSTGNVSLELPKEFVNEITKGHTSSKEPAKYRLGTNYSAKLYEESKMNKSNLPLIIGLSSATLILIVVTAIVVVVLKKKNKKETTQSENNSVGLTDDELIAKIEEEYKITSREKDVLRLILQGKRRSEMAKELFLSESAVKKYISSLYAKIGVHSKLELVVKYQSNKL